MVLEMQVIGNLGNDAVVKDVNGKRVCNFSVAHTEKYKDAQGVQHERTTWVTCGMWQGEAVWPYLKKGTLVLLNGTPSVQPYTSKDGQAKAELRLSVLRVKLLSKPAAPAGAAPVASTQAAQQSIPAAGEMELADDLPF
ncbi:single-stranded DNA-binding protein [Phnomibacter sp. MR]|uniref:single-stranded DNA-binding protein n=1 Tax=Phnomibacter sp. MR TaxID=3042318 RepID=UPI003A80381E